MPISLLMLRGQVPTDRGKGGWKEILYPNITQCMDFYTLLAYEMTRGKDDWCEVVYWGRDRKKFIDYNAWEIWVKRLRDYKPAVSPTVIFARGGFLEYHRILKRYPDAFKIYYGAGKRYGPQPGFTNYDLVLVDTYEQVDALQTKFPNLQIGRIEKAAPTQFRPLERVEKEYDVCYVAVHPEDARKRCRWVYKTCPKDLRVLQLGYAPKAGAPKNFTVRYVPREKMPTMMNKCRVGIAPYTPEDSGPRVIVEMLACGLPVVCLDATQDPALPVTTTTKAKFWERVSRETRVPPCKARRSVIPSVEDVAQRLRHHIERRTNRI